MRSQLGPACLIVFAALTMSQHTAAAQTPCGAAQEQVDLIRDDVEGPLLWTPSGMPASPTWSVSTLIFHSPSRSWFSPNASTITDQRLTYAAQLSVPATAVALHLAFRHRYNFEAGFDGGVVEYSIDGGTTWRDADSHFTLNGYNRTISTCCANPLRGRRAFSSSNIGSPAFLLTAASLPPSPGSAFSLRFRTGTDTSGTLRGWNVDDVHLYACVSAATGTLQFNAATYWIAEDGGTATITVDRVNGSQGTVAVSYATSSGTAISGVDFSASSGTLVFADGETSKTFVVPVFDDFETEPPESINLTLSSPTQGAMLGTPSIAVLTISDNCPATGPGQPDFDGDGAADECDSDDDNDGRADADDPDDTNPTVCGDTDHDSCDDCASGTVQPQNDGTDTDADGQCNAGDTDDDNDGVLDAVDNCPLDTNADQADRDHDAQGDACDGDDDGDGVADPMDACPATPPGSIVNATGCAVADMCPCPAARNHGQYVSCVMQAAQDFMKAGLITNEMRQTLINAAAQSNCGRK